jgi:hypothetical protein
MTIQRKPVGCTVNEDPAENAQLTTPVHTL